MIHRVLIAGIFAIPLVPLAARAADAPDTNAPADTQQLDSVSVIGQGGTRQVRRITRQETVVPPSDTCIQKLLNHISRRQRAVQRRLRR